MTATPLVSIVIVSMNKPALLADCLDSIRQHTTVSYEVLVVAYLYSAENLASVTARYPWVTFIESREIRGFSENNNLALRQARGTYCFVLNDDTLVHEGAIDRLAGAFGRLDDRAAIVSPVIVDAHGDVAYSGRAPFTVAAALKDYLHPGIYKTGPYTQGTGLYPTYNILGAAFMIRTDLFRQMGWFDEYYFFTPEDIDVSTRLNRQGYTCHVLDDARITHLEGMSGKSTSSVQTATHPAATLGVVHFLARGSRWRAAALRALLAPIMLLKAARHTVAALAGARADSARVLARAELHSLRALFTCWTPKQAFVHYYQHLKTRQ